MNDTFLTFLPWSQAYKEFMLVMILSHCGLIVTSSSA